MEPKFGYPTQQELKLVEQSLLPQLTEGDPIFDEFPIVEQNSHRLRWEQMDNFQGLQQARGMGGAFRPVENVGSKGYDFEPGVYGEFGAIDEAELTERRELGRYEEFADIDDLVGMKQVQLLQRRLDRIRQILWKLVSAGQYSVSDRGGSVKHYGVFPIREVTAPVAWSSAATAKPYADILALALQYRGQSVDFAGGKLYLNRTKVNQLLTNANAADLFGRRVSSGETINNLETVNGVLKSNDLPTIVPYDRGYVSDGTDGNSKGAFVTFLPDNVGVLVGKRTSGATLGEYRMTRNANNPNVEPGPYTRVRDLGEVQSPRTFGVEDGHNGGPVIYFPGAVVKFIC